MNTNAAGSYAWMVAFYTAAVALWVVDVCLLVGSVVLMVSPALVWTGVVEGVPGREDAVIAFPILACTVGAFTLWRIHPLPRKLLKEANFERSIAGSLRK